MLDCRTTISPPEIAALTHGRRPELTSHRARKCPRPSDPVFSQGGAHRPTTARADARCQGPCRWTSCLVRTRRRLRTRRVTRANGPARTRRRGGPARSTTLEGPIWTRNHKFTWDGRTITQHETFFLCHLAEPLPADTIRPDGPEGEFFAGARWCRAAEISTLKDIVAPRHMAELLEPIIAGRLPSQPIDIGP